ncbi:molybdopterin-dependent oxidoreductase [Raoultibacter phocaeensis]|uniref:molybdopterin-dependent oxidoreductase n=1 Tax=Raoultibacter phocaeensis TaxID=2479841 RepID=UPI00111A2529|nr:molybdopterin-dependent oxidoreductase [Raoultibacter phocaeensis]
MKDSAKEGARMRPRVNIKAVLVLVAFALVASAAIWGCSPQASTTEPKPDGAKEESSEGAKTAVDPDAVDGLATYSGFPTEGRFVDGVVSLPDFYKNSEKNEANAKAEAPRRYTDRNGFTVQPVPSDPVSWNNTYLDADNRGCTSCHSLENALMTLPTYHRLIFFGYPTEQSYQNCIACHSKSYSGISLADITHTRHFESTMFNEDYSGDCQSCHHISADTGEFERWDEVKYNLYKGITDVAADDLKADISYDQTTITPAENRIFKTVKDEPSEWLTDDANVDPSIYENWVISIDGDCENPAEMTLPEMVEQFGTVKQVMKMDCTINGVGQATIMQSEVEGIPLSAIIEYAKPKAGANTVSPIGSDGYDYAQMSIDWLLENDAIIVTKMDGEVLPNTQGYPCMIWVNKTSGGNFTKRISNLTFMTKDEADLDNQLYVGQFTDDKTGEIYSKPNSGVLNYPTGVVLTGDEAKTVHLEGFADAWDEPIKKIEYSFDHGATWTVLETPDNNADNWTYWRMDFTPPATGAYLLDIRTTSITPDGADRVCQYDTQFMFTVE